jgi:hypothetical protein
MSSAFTETTGEVSYRFSAAQEEDGDGGGMIRCGDVLAPATPTDLENVDVDPHVLADIALKLAHTVPNFTTDWAVQKLCLSLPVTAQLLEQLRADRLLEVQGQTGPLRHRFAITGRGCERVSRLQEICGYVGPAPVSLETYRMALEWQLGQFPEPTPELVAAAIADYVFPPHAIEVVGLAASSGRSLFVHGPPGNGKSSLGHILPRALAGQLWVPHCISVDNTIIRFFDPQCHRRVELDLPPHQLSNVDSRWVPIRRPFVEVGGELRTEDLDLSFSTALRCYEAPVHLKANGGTFLLDDLGCQRDSPHELLKRWIIPLEYEYDYLTLQTGQKLWVPFRQLLIVSTNLDPDRVMEPAILRRMGYRLHLTYPSAAQYAEIFRRYAARYDFALPDGLLDRLIRRYQGEGRPLRSCDPRDLIERVRDICRFHGCPPALNEELLDVAWRGYFGNSQEDVPADTKPPQPR